MKLAIMQPYLFPYIGYWQLINAVDCFVIYDDVSFIKQGFINRNNLLINGKCKLFTLELFGASSNKLINQVQVGENSKKVIKTIKYGYSKAPYFEDTFPLIEDILNNDEKNLAAFLAQSLKNISEFLGIDTNFICSSEIEKDNSLRSQDKVIEICNKIGATMYINAIGGQKLYSKSAFKKEQIDLKFISTQAIKYGQYNNEFVPNLSIIDVMMFNSIEQIHSYLLRYNLV
jgi:hypothetical protein